MPLSIDKIRNAANRVKSSRIRSLSEARAQGLKTAFLCHSHHDAQLVRGIITLLDETGWRVYVDWADESMPETPTRETAMIIKRKIVELNYFLFLATPNSMSSKWCPWEIGFADGKKDINTIMIIPTLDSSGRWHGSEYLQLYRKIDEAPSGGLAVWDPGQPSGIWLRTL